LALAACAGLAASPASALTAGDKASRVLVLGGKQIPLPGGEWVLAGLGTQDFEMPALGAFGTIQTAILFLTRGDRVDAVLEVNATTIPVNDGWGRTEACADGKQQLLVVAHYKTGWETSCAFLVPTEFGLQSPPGPSAWTQARDYARQAKLAMTTLW